MQHRPGAQIFVYRAGCQNPGWHGLVAISIGLTVLLLAVMFRDSGGLAARGRDSFALVAYAITTFAVWMVGEYSHQYLTPATLAGDHAVHCSAWCYRRPAG